MSGDWKDEYPSVDVDEKGAPEELQAPACLTRRTVALEKQVVFRAAENDAMRATLLRERESRASLIELLLTQIDAVRAERDSEAAAVRMLRAKLRDGVIRHVSAREAEPRSAQPETWQQGGGEVARRIAVLADEFTTAALAPSCEMCAVDVVHWQTQLDEFKPELLFVESAWHGNGGQWSRKVHQLSKELIDLLSWCKSRRVPTVFWNKEDPVHFDTFINAAKRFDYVFTTALECVSSYKTLLGHDRVFLMPFWGQPRLHSPVEEFHRKDGFCFAGAYYRRYPERQRDFDVLIDALSGEMPVEIYDRNFGKDDPNYAFPDRYKSMIRGRLSYDEMDRAYKGYSFGLNLNSVKQSQSMFARRVFDLMLCNTHVVSNYSRGLRLLFGSLVTSTDSEMTALASVRDLRTVESKVSAFRMRRLLALRKVMLEHTADHRIAYIYKKVFGVSVTQKALEVIVAAKVSNADEFKRVLSAYDRQAWGAKQLVMVVDGLADRSLLFLVQGRHDVSLLTLTDASSYRPSLAWPGKAVALFSPRDYYGDNYLTDMAIGFQYSAAEVVGKASYYHTSGSEIELIQEGAQYKWHKSLPFRRSVAMSSALSGTSLSQWLRTGDGVEVSGAACLSLDEFNYVCEGRESDYEELSESAIDVGLPLSQMLSVAEEVRGFSEPDEIGAGLEPEALFSLFEGSARSGAVKLELTGGALMVHSSLEPAKHQYIYASQTLGIAQVSDRRDEMTFNLLALPGLQVDAVFIFYSSQGKRIGHTIRPFGRNHTEAFPVGAEEVRFGLRVLGPGVARITGLALSAVQGTEFTAPQIGRSRYLVVTNAYPSSESLYRNGFVHRRITGYRELGVSVDVFVLDTRGLGRSYEHEGVDVTVGDENALKAVLATNSYESILVHFLDAAMWGVINMELPRSRVVVWIHGAEVQPWHRRRFNYSSELELERAQKSSLRREELWREVFGREHPNLHFVFVSRYLAEEVMQDYQVRVPEHSYSVIHNVIDGQLFSYHPKGPADRFKILSIRPYASRKYANDLTVQAILLLKDKPYFDDLEFRLVGQGALLEDVVAPVRELPNVKIDQRFLTQAEISALHQEYGVFLNPTRWDSQGVSRDEAMASGLVPITNRVSAIPEFMDEGCGFMVPGEDADGLAEAIDELVRNEVLFQKMSAAAALRPRAQCNFERTIARELRLFAPSNEARCTTPSNIRE